jgi:hypothetical protein
MASTAIVTVVKMMETLPETTQNQIVERLRNYVSEMQDEIQWDVSFRNTTRKNN